MRKTPIKSGFVFEIEVWDFIVTLLYMQHSGIVCKILYFMVSINSLFLIFGLNSFAYEYFIIFARH